MTHEIKLELASGARLTLLYFSDREMRWIFTYHYVGLKDPGKAPEIVNEVYLAADYVDGLLASQLMLSMHVIIPSRLGHRFFAGMDISPGAKTFLEFSYERGIKISNAGSVPIQSAAEYRLVEICKGARERVRLDDLAPALVRPIEFPFPIPDRLPVEGCVRVPFRLNNGDIAHFELPTRTLR